MAAATSTGLTRTRRKTPFFAFFNESQKRTVKKVCQGEHFKTFRKAIGPELGLYILFPFADPFPFLFSLNLSLVVESSAHLTDLTHLTNCL